MCTKCTHKVQILFFSYIFKKMLVWNVDGPYGMMIFIVDSYIYTKSSQNVLHVIYHTDFAENIFLLTPSHHTHIIILPQG